MHYMYNTNISLWLKPMSYGRIDFQVRRHERMQHWTLNVDYDKQVGDGEGTDMSELMTCRDMLGNEYVAMYCLGDGRPDGTNGTCHWLFVMTLTSN